MHLDVHSDDDIKTLIVVKTFQVFLNAGVDVNLVKYEGPRKAISTGMVPLHMTAFGPHGGHKRAAEVSNYHKLLILPLLLPSYIYTRHYLKISIE